jgi:hypothetical protein
LLEALTHALFARQIREMTTKLQRLSEALDSSREPPARNVHIAERCQRVSLQEPLTSLAVEDNALFERRSGFIVTIEAR